MTVRRRFSIALILLALTFPASAAEWFDDYFAGIDAAKKKDWGTVVQKMSAAIAKKPNEENKAKTYGVQFISYHPYYYRGVAYINQGRWSDAVEDLKRATGVGELNLGDPGTLLITANQQLVAEQIRSQPATPPPAQPQQPPAQPAGPDPKLVAARQQAEDAIQTARTKLNRAQQADASINAPRDFDAASNLLKQATSANINADTVADYGKVADLADRAARSFDAAVTNAQIRIADLERARRAREQQQPTASTPAIPAPQPPSTRAVEETLAETKTRLRQALQMYFDGDFSASASRLAELSLDQPNNAMIFAFLGASRYYDYYLHGQSDAAKLQQAKDALRQAKSINPSLKLDPNYFSTRVRGFYEMVN